MMERNACPSAWLISEVNQYVAMAFSTETQLSRALAGRLVMTGVALAHLCEFS
jgi:hypothetical protein